MIALAVLCAATPAPGVNVTVGAGIVGSTPEIVGYNSGHFMPGSNTADFWRYSGVNGARVWPTPSVVEGTDDGGGWGDGVSSESTFLARRTALRETPLSTAYINWPYFENRYQNNPTTGANIINLNHAFSTMRSLGIDPLVAINRTNEGAFAWDAAGTTAGWADRWEHWQHFYAQAFYLAKNFDVHRFQMYNEPNADTDLPLAEYVERLQFASDAVQSAVADVNRLYGKSLDAQMQGPVHTSGSTHYSTWGAPVMSNLHNTIDSEFRLIDTYAYHQYNSTGEQFGSHLASIKNSVNAAAPGEGIRFAITEFNVHTAGNFDTMPETLETPSKSSRLGSILANLANNRPHELYVFKLSQGPGDGPTGVKKNGTHYVDNGNAPYNIGGVTKGGEVVRLFAKGFAGANELFSVPTKSGTGATDLRLSASHDVEKDRYYLFSANEATSARSLTVDLAGWGIEPGARVIVEEVSADRHGEVSHVLTVPPNRLLTLPASGQAAQSVLLFSVPKNKAAYELSLGATDDAMVKAGANASAVFGDSPNLYAKNEPVTPGARNVSFIKFDTGTIPSSSIEQAILQVNAQNSGSASQVIAHMYGLTNDAWNEATINWNNAPNLADSNGTALDDISENFIEGVGTSAFFVGHFTGTSSERQTGIDVTSFLQQHPDQEVTFLVAREVRFDGENVDDDLTSLQIASKERGAVAGPQMLLSLAASALPGDYSRDGIVDTADYDEWKRTFGGTMDAADYVVWRKNFGASLPGVVGGASGHGALVPEPTTVVLLGLGAAALRLFGRIGARSASKGDAATHNALASAAGSDPELLRCLTRADVRVLHEDRVCIVVAEGAGRVENLRGTMAFRIFEVDDPANLARFAGGYWAAVE
jgi:hypothetical protein